MLSCQQAARLISQQQDRKLTVAEKAGLKFHTLICSGCKNYQQQLRFIHHACQSVVPDNKK